MSDAVVRPATAADGRRHSEGFLADQLAAAARTVAVVAVAEVEGVAANQIADAF